MEDKIFLEDLLNIKKSVDQMDLLEFRSLWHARVKDYSTADYSDRLTTMVLSLKMLQAKADLSRMTSSLQECSEHPEREKAIYYYLRANLWKFLDNFKYILFMDELEDEAKLEGLKWLEHVSDIIAQDEQLTKTCATRLHRLLKQVQVLRNAVTFTEVNQSQLALYSQVIQEISSTLNVLEPAGAIEEPTAPTLNIPDKVQELIQQYSAFSVARISIEKSGVLSIIQLLCEHPFSDLQAHQTELQEALKSLEKQAFYSSSVSSARNQCAYALVILLEMMKMHKGLPVLLLRILDLCTYIHFPSSKSRIRHELNGLKGRVTEISQKRLRPIIEDVLWKSPEFLSSIPHLRKSCPWCYYKSSQKGVRIPYVRQVITSSFDRLMAAQQIHFTPDNVGKSRLSEIVIEILGLLVNIEPSPHFLKIHAKESQKIKDAKMAIDAQTGLVERLLDQQYDTYKSHLKFLQDSIEYYQGILEKFQESPNGHIRM